MLNRLPDRGSDTKRSVGDFQEAQKALGRAAGWQDREGAFAINDEETQLIGVGHGHVEGVGNAQRRSEEFQSGSEVPYKAREGDMYN
jgi:hypothetical protein